MGIPKILHFIKYFEEGFMDYFHRIRDTNSIFLFDLEDSIQDLSNHSNDEKLKKKYRAIIKKLLLANKEIYQKSQIGIRINTINSTEFEEDITLLKDLKTVQWETIILPKTESREQIYKLIEILDRNLIKYNNITIIAETKKGFSELRQIVFPEIKRLKYVIFGHADYNIDNEFFPFIHHNQKEYWSWIDEILHKLEGTNLIFVNSPCLFLEDEILFKANLNNLNNRCVSEFGQVTLTHEQTKMCVNYEASNEIDFDDCNSEKLDPVIFAKKIIDCLNAKKTEKSFVINDGGYLISPHEIIMAKRILKT